MSTHIIQMQPAIIESATAMKLSKVGNQTNSQDPQAVNSRVFVGNLNTFQCSKTDVERMFQRYGRIAGISMHKGYAFVQFTNPFDARSACLGEDGRTVLNQVLDVNMVAEPKPHQTGRKRQNVSKTGNDWDYYYDSYYAAAVAPRLVPPLKRPRLMVTQSRSMLKNPSTTGTTTATTGVLQQQKTNGQISPTSTSPVSSMVSLAATNCCSNSVSATALTNHTTTTNAGQFKTYSNPDILICGNCREMFTELQELLDHKKTYCKLRFTCKCHTINGIKPANHHDSAASLLCVQCKDSFQSAWDLMVHVQAAHMVNIYELGIAKNDNLVSSPQHNHKDSDVGSHDEDDILCQDEDTGLDSPDLDKDRENDSMDIEGSEPCTLHNIKLDNGEAVIPTSLLKSLTNGGLNGTE